MYTSNLADKVCENSVLIISLFQKGNIPDMLLSYPDSFAGSVQFLPLPVLIL